MGQGKQGEAGRGAADPLGDADSETLALPERMFEPTAVTADLSESAIRSVESTVVPSAALATMEAAITSPQQAMRFDELRRMRFFSLFAGLLATMAGALLFVLPGDLLAKNIHLAGAILTSFVAFAIAITIRDGTRYRRWMGTLLGLAAAAATSAGFYYWGIFSAIVLVVPIGTYFFALGESYWSALAIHVAASAAHAVIGFLQIFGVTADVGMIQALELNRIQLVGMLLAIQIVFMGAFLMARALRSASMHTLEVLDGAVRSIAQREALLEEAKEELARARKVGDPGRFTGQVLGSYRLGNILGRGGMGDVYEAVHVKTNELAAVKLLNQAGMANPGLVARFYRELDIAEAIQAENVVRVLEHPEPDAPVPYLAMERLTGETLGDVLRANPKMSMSQILRLIKSLTSGIGAAHELSIVHRDLKPQNVLAHQKDGKTVWKILDFGVSKLIDHSGTLTQGKMVGTPTYMSPEQAAGEDVDARADIYSIGVILYRVLTGRPAFRGASLPAILMAVRFDMPPKPSAIAETTPEFDCVLAIAMAKNAEDRFETTRELATAVQEAADGKLSPEIQQRGQLLMEKYPWGQKRVC